MGMVGRVLFKRGVGDWGKEERMAKLVRSAMGRGGRLSSNREWFRASHIPQEAMRGRALKSKTVREDNQIFRLLQLNLQIKCRLVLGHV
jgi:hypothetical protein